MGFYEDNREYLPKSEPQVNNKVKGGLMAYLPSAILTLILVALSGLGALIQVNFSLKNVVWTTFLISLSLRLISNFLSKYVGSNLYYNKALYSEELQGFKKDFLDSGKDIDKNLFESYVAQDNLESKKKSYIKKKRGKLTMLQEKANKLERINKLDFTKARDRKIKRYQKQIKELEDISSDEYIDANIIYLKVKYPKVKTYYFLSPEEDCAESKEKYNINYSRENTIEILKSLPLTATLVFFGALISYDAVMGNVNAMSVLYDIGNMAFNFILGWFVIGKRLISKTINTYINRQTFIAKFKSKIKNN
jgi:hypothetical protein